MPSANPNVLTVACPGCGAKFRFLAETAGHKTHCAKCGLKFLVPKPSASAAAAPAASVGVGASAAAAVREPAAEPEYIGFGCRVCETRMYALVGQVGEKLKCPDCGALTVVPPAPPPKTRNIPAALEGEQYELWEPDAAPLPSELVARQPKYIAITCRNCATLMYATEDQVGQAIRCPDCGTRHTVAAPPKPKPRPSVLARDAETPQLDPSAAPGERPPALSAEVQQRIEREATQPKSELGDKLDRRGRPIPPRYPLVTGIWLFPFYAGCRMRWLVLTCGLWPPAGLLIDGIPGWLLWQGDAAGALRAMGGLAESLIGAVLLIVWLAAASNIFFAIVTESSEGHGHIANWPRLTFIDSMAEILPVIVAATFTAGPGWALGHLVSGDALLIWSMAGATLLLGFPVALLSQLSGGSTWDLLEPRVLAALVRCPISTLLFYVQSAILAAVCLSATMAAAQRHYALPLALTPLYIGSMMIYARLVGRLGLRLAEKMPPRGEEA